MPCEKCQTMSWADYGVGGVRAATADGWEMLPNHHGLVRRCADCKRAAAQPVPLRYDPNCWRGQLYFVSPLEPGRPYIITRILPEPVSVTDELPPRGGFEFL